MKKIKRHSYIISTPGMQDAGAKHLQQVVFELERRGVHLSKDERALLIRRIRSTGGTWILKDANRKTLAIVIKTRHMEVRKNPAKARAPKMYRWYIPGGRDCLAPTHEDARRILGPYGSIYRKGKTNRAKKNPGKKRVPKPYVTGDGKRFHTSMEALAHAKKVHERTGKFLSVDLRGRKEWIEAGNMRKNPSKADRKLLTAAGAYRAAKGFQPHNRADVLAARVKLLQKAEGTPRYASLVKQFRKADR